MALRRNSLFLGIIAVAACAAAPALADDSTITGREPDGRNDYLDPNYIYDYMGHQDSITTGLGDAPTSNIIIMHPTPWPSYINKTKIQTRGSQGISALEQMMEQQSGGGEASSGASSPGGTVSLLPSGN